MTRAPCKREVLQHEVSRPREVLVGRAVRMRRVDDVTPAMKLVPRAARSRQLEPAAAAH